MKQIYAHYRDVRSAAFCGPLWWAARGARVAFDAEQLPAILARVAMLVVDAGASRPLREEVAAAWYLSLSLADGEDGSVTARRQGGEGGDTVGAGEGQGGEAVEVGQGRDQALHRQQRMDQGLASQVAQSGGGARRPRLGPGDPDARLGRGRAGGDGHPSRLAGSTS